MRRVILLSEAIGYWNLQYQIHISFFKLLSKRVPKTYNISGYFTIASGCPLELYGKTYT